MMKKWLLGLLMVCLLLCTCTALADEVELKLIDNRVDKNLEWLAGTDYIVVGEYGKRALADEDGNKLTKSAYRYLSDTYVDRGIIYGTDSEDDKGLLSTDLDILVPFDYKDVRVINCNWAMCTPHSGSKLEFWNLPRRSVAFTMSSSDYANSYSPTGCELVLVEDSDGKIGVYNAQGEMIDTTSKLYGYAGAEENPPYEMFRLEEGLTMVDQDGTMVIVPGDYTYLTTDDGWYFRAGRGSESGVIDANGTVIVPFDKDNDLRYSSWAPALHHGYAAGGYASAVRDDHLHFYDLYGNLSASFDYSFKDGEFTTLHASAYSTKNEGSAILLAADGRESTVRYDKSFWALSGGSGYFYEAVNSEYNYALYDWHGKQVLPYKYSDFQISTDGRRLLAKPKDGKYAEIYEITYPDLWYEMYDASRFDGVADAIVASLVKDDPSLSALVDALEQGVLGAPAADVNALPSAPKLEPPARTGSILTNNRPTPVPAATAAPTATPAPAPQPTAAPAPVQPAQVPAPVQPAASTGNAEVDALLSSALILLDTSAEASGQAIAQLIAAAASMLEGTPAAGILQSAAILASTNAAGNAIGIQQLIQTAQTMY